MNFQLPEGVTIVSVRSGVPTEGRSLRREGSDFVQFEPTPRSTIIWHADAALRLARPAPGPIASSDGSGVAATSESFFAPLKNEMYYRQTFGTRSRVQRIGLVHHTDGRNARCPITERKKSVAPSRASHQLRVIAQRYWNFVRKCANISMQSAGASRISRVA